MFDRIDKGLWWDQAWSLTAGCTEVSPACANCWSRAQSHMWQHNPNAIIAARHAGLVRPDGSAWTGTVRFCEDQLEKPLKIKTPKVFSVWNDLFHECVMLGEIRSALDVIAQCPRHIFIVLTKRIGRAHDLCAAGRIELPRNLWLGTTAEDQKRADERIPLLLRTPATRHVISIEPMLGPVDLTTIRHGFDHDLPILGTDWGGPDWVIAGGESGPNARPMHPDWARSLRDQCAEAQVPFFFKQWGEWVSVSEVAGRGEHYHFPDEATVRRVGKKIAGRRLDGHEHLEVPKVAA